MMMTKRHRSVLSKLFYRTEKLPRFQTRQIMMMMKRRSSMTRRAQNHQLDQLVRLTKWPNPLLPMMTGTMMMTRKTTTMITMTKKTLCLSSLSSDEELDADSDGDSD
jgi:hypothetical protein